MLWISAVILALATTAFALSPLWRGRTRAPARAAHDVAVFKKQLTEIDRDLERGLISESEADGARREISRRLLAAADAAERDGDIEPASAGVSQAVLGVSAATIVLGALLLYGELLGEPNLPDMPLAGRDFAAETAAARLSQAEAEALYLQSVGGEVPSPAPPDTPEGQPDFETLLARMEAAIAERPDDVQGRVILARAYLRVGRAAEGWPLLQEAAALLGERAPDELHIELGEAMTVATGGYVSREAQRAFERAPEQPMSRYFIGLAFAQDGEMQRALDHWIRLLRDYPSAPFSAMLRHQIEEMAGEAGFALRPDALPPVADTPTTPPPGPRAPGPTADQVAAAQAMTPEERQEMILGMVEGLAASLEDEPDNIDGWLRLIRAYGVLGETEAATRAFNDARAVFADAPDAMSALVDQARAAGATVE